MEWMYNSEPFTGPSDRAVGFVYLITNKLDGRRYIGKKLFFFTKTKTLKGKKKRVKAESDWRDYWSSSEELKADVQRLGTENFTREIIHLCDNKGTMNYLEAREQFDNRVLEQPGWYNGYIMCRLHRTHVKL